MARFATGRKKLGLLERISLKIDSVKFLFQLSWESRLINNNRYIILSEHLDKLGRQTGGWLKKSRQENSPPLTERT